MKKKPRTIDKHGGSGEFASKADVKANPETTYTMTINEVTFEKASQIIGEHLKKDVLVRDEFRTKVKDKIFHALLNVDAVREAHEVATDAVLELFEDCR